MAFAISRKRLVMLGALLMAASMLVVVTEAAEADAHTIVLNNARCEFMVDVTAVRVLADTDPVEVDSWTIEPAVTIFGNARIDVWKKECRQIVEYREVCPARDPSNPQCAIKIDPNDGLTWQYLNPADGFYYKYRDVRLDCRLRYLGHRDTPVEASVIGSTTFDGDVQVDPYLLDAPVGTEAIAARAYPNRDFKIQLLQWNAITAASVAVQVRENDAYYSDSGASGALTFTVIDPCDPFGGFLASFFGPLVGFPTAPIFAGDNDTWSFPVIVKKAAPRGQGNAETDGVIIVDLEMRSEPYWDNYPWGGSPIPPPPPPIRP